MKNPFTNRYNNAGNRLWSAEQKSFDLLCLFYYTNFLNE